MVGQVVGRYRILAKLGEGGMGTVWKAQHTLLPDRLVALKFLSESLWTSEEARQRFLREAIAVSKLDHPLIAALHDAEHVDGQLYIAFKFIDGDTVARKTDAGPLGLGEVLTIAADAAAALAHAHARGVLHRDVSAGNIMVDREGRGVLVDFGLALPGPDAHLTRTGTTQGTLPYMAPEVLNYQPAEARSDLYGLGVVLYRMLTGRLPFESTADKGLVYEILNARPQPPSVHRSSIPPGLDDLVLRLLEKDPADRPANTQLLLDELRRFQSQAALQTGATLPIDRPADPLRRRVYGLRRWLHTRAARRALAAGAVAMTLLVAGGVVWRLRTRSATASRVTILAVLPVRNSSPDSAEVAYLAEAFGDGLVAKFTGVAGIRVLPWLTTGRYGSGAEPLPKIARELGASQLLVGSYASDGERIRATMSLVDGKGLQRWSRTFEDAVEGISALRDAIARAAIEELIGTRAASPVMTAPRSPEAYEYFLRGASFWHSSDPSEQALAEYHFQKAVELDSTLAEAYVGLGAVLTDRYFRGDLGGVQNLSLAERYFRRALRINPRLGAAERGLIRVFTERGPTEEALKIASAAARRSPDDVDALLTSGWGYTIGGLLQESLPFYVQALALDPASAAGAYYQIVALNWADRLEESLEAGKAYIRRFGEDPEVYLWMGVSAHGLERRREARPYYERASRLYGDNVNYSALYLASLYRQEGEIEKMRAFCIGAAASMERRLAAFPDNLRLRSDLATIYAMLGDRKRYREQFEILSDAFARPLPASGGDNAYLPLALAQAGDLAGALEALQELRGDPASWLPVVNRTYIGPIMAGGRVHELLARPEWKSFVDGIEAEMVRRRALYAPRTPLAGAQR